MKNSARYLAVSAAAIAGAIALSGCSAVDEIAYKQRSLEFVDQSALAADGTRKIAWVPSDGTGIKIVESTVASDAALLVTSSSDLDQTMCLPHARLSAPSYTMEGAPDVYAISDAFVCGDWTVVPTEDGWYGWTPNSESERAER